MKTAILLIIIALSSCKMLSPNKEKDIPHIVIKRGDIFQCPKGYVKCAEGHCHKAVRPSVKPRVNQFH